ncbi:MAG: nucleoside triphosphate pyrophosphohydrolase [Chloroflexi bacterium]|nr:nucleoside triphosphate pyrophosphohydrolase [Chloroflexota bacterium]
MRFVAEASSTSISGTHQSRKWNEVIVVGLGPGDPDHLTARATAVITGAASSGQLVLRTRIHPTVEKWPLLAIAPSFDHIYEEAADFETVYRDIVASLLDRIGHQSDTPLVYAVPGHPSIGEATVLRLRDECRDRGITVTVVPGLSFIDAIAPLLDVDVADGLHIVDSLSVTRIDPTVPILVCQIHSRRVATHVKLTLASHYPDTHPVVIIQAAGVSGQMRTNTVELWELDHRDDLDHLTTVFVKPLDQLSAVREPATLALVMARLRADNGCPWDREQTHKSLRRFLLEETYEALEKLDAGDVAGLEEELGDILLQIFFHAQIATETGAFDFGDVVAGIVSKMIRRHPHVFGDAEATTADAVLQNWEATKRAERDAVANTEADTDRKVRTSMLDGVPRSLPALAQSQSIQDRAARVGFDWPDITGVLDKIVEEARELTEADEAGRASEVGDLLFTLVNLSRRLGVDAEEALRGSANRFRARFSHVEASVANRGVEWSTLAASDLDTMWNDAKRATASGTIPDRDAMVDLAPPDGSDPVVG